MYNQLGLLTYWVDGINNVKIILKYPEGGAKMQIENNSRQIPSNERYTANKNYSDILYGYLQNISVLDEALGMRYIEKKDIKYTKIAEDLGVTRQTVSKKFNSLIEEGLLSFDGSSKRYYLLVLEAELATLLPSDTVKILCNTLQERCLSVLAYLLKTYIQHGSQACEVNLEVIKGYVGLSKTNRGSNNEIIRDIFLVLSKLGLIKFKAEKALDQATGGYKTRYVLEEVNNKVDFFE